MAKEKTAMVAISGLSPAVVTETIWALYQEKPDYVPDDVYVYTTLRGKQEFQEKVLSATGNRKCIWDQLCETVGKPGLRYHIRPFTDEQGTALEDITSAEHQLLIADCLLNAIRHLKNEQGDSCRIVASIAGGRKSMSALMYAAMSYGADGGDIITHVLADERASDCPCFFFPAQSPQKLKTLHSQKEFTAKRVRLELAELPFAPLRSLVGAAVEDAHGSFKTLVERARARLGNMDVEKTTIRLSRTKCEATIDGTPISMPAESYALLAMLVYFRAQCAEPTSLQLCTGAEVLEKLYAEQLLPREVVARKNKHGFYKAWAENERPDAVWPNTISKTKSELKKILLQSGKSKVAADLISNRHLGFIRIHDVAFLND